MNSTMTKSTKRAAPWQTPAVVQTSTVVLLVVLWETIGRSGLLFPELFPSLLTVLQSVWVYLTTPVALPHLDASGRAVGGALLLGALTGIPLGIICGSWRSWLEIVEPLILYAAVVPKIVIFPIFILFLGIGVGSKLAVGAFAAFFPIALLTIAGMRDVKRVYIDVARTMGASAAQIAAQVYLPAIAGQVFTGVRIGMGAAVTGALLAETKIAKAGLGFLIVEYYGQFRIAEMYGLLLLIFIMAATANWTLKTLFGLLSPSPRGNQDAGMYF